MLLMPCVGKPSKGFKALEGWNYHPKLTVATKLWKGSPSGLSRDLGRDGGSERKWVQISISDNGPGIPEDIKDKVLQPFFTTKKGTEGTGLGLSITHDIVKAHGGELDIQSQPGRTVFKTYLPY